MRAAVVGGTAYYAGKKVQQGREQDAETEARLEDVEAQQAAAPQAAAPAPAGGMSEEAIEQLKQLGDLTQGDFDEHQHNLLYGG